MFLKRINIILTTRIQLTYNRRQRRLYLQSGYFITCGFATMIFDILSIINTDKQDEFVKELLLKLLARKLN